MCIVNPIDTMMNICQIDPPCWFTGMKHHELQLLVYGTDLKKVNVSTTLPHIFLDIHEGATPYSFFIHITLSEEAQPGTYTINFEKDHLQQQWTYKLLERRIWSAEKSSTINSADVIYLIMPDRFALDELKVTASKEKERQANEWHGGSLNGLSQHLSYLEELGVTALWLTPVLENKVSPIHANGNIYDSYHGYSITDFYAIDPHFGTLADYQQLIHKAHQHGLKIIADLVFNHCSHRHKWLKHPPIKGWFKESNVHKARKTNYCLTTLFDPYASTYDRQNTVDGWFTDHMPDLNLQNQQVWQYLTQMTIWWIETTGIDAIRMDTFLYADSEGMWKWLQYIDQEYPGFSILAEAWVGEAAYTAQVQRAAQAHTHSRAPLVVMDFAFRERMLECFSQKQLYAKEGSLYNHFVYDFLYPTPQQTLAFLDNHDTARWFSTARSVAKQKQAIGLLLTCPRIPQLFYGTEIGLPGDGKGTGDGNYRQDFFDKFNPSQRSHAENVLFSYVQKLLHWRKHSQAICHGSMKHFIPQQGVYVYFRTYLQEKVMIIANLTTHQQTIWLAPYEEELNGLTLGKDVISQQYISLQTSSLLLKSNQLFILELA